MQSNTAEQEWTRLDGERSTLISRCENYAALTIPKICLPNGFDMNNAEQSLDYQSDGARCVNSLTNKFMMTMFSPSRPFFRAGADAATKAELAKVDMTEADLADGLGQIEREAVRQLDRKGQRPKLYQILRHLIITGNGLLYLGKDQMRVMGVKYYVVKRNAEGKVITLVIREKMCVEELTQDVQDEINPPKHHDTEVCLYKWIRFEDGRYKMTTWVDNQKLSDKFDGNWSEDDLPYRALAWDLADEADYGTGLVEEYIGALEATSVLAEAVVDGSVLGTEFRWMVNPTGLTTAQDLNESKNGDALPGRPEDVDAVQGGNPQAVATADGVLQRYQKQLAEGFLLFSSTVRNAERVTAEEIRQQAQELESSYGGVYSMLGNILQAPVARWCLTGVDTKLLSGGLEYTIITGLDALSRGGDLENLRLALNDLAGVAALPPEFQGRVKFNAIAAYVGNGRGIDLRPFLKSDDEYAAYLQQQQQSRVAEQAAVNASQAQSQAQAQGSTP